LAIEDFLDPTGVTLEAFAAEFTGSWMFGWARALRSAGLSPLLLCVSRRVRAPRRMVHAPTGTPILVVPASPAYRALAERMADPYARDPDEAAPGLPAPLRAAARELAPYLAASPIALARAIRSERVAAVICQEYEFPRFDAAVALGRALRVPVYATFQGGDYQRWRLERILRPRTVPAAAGLLIGSRAEAERVRERYGATRVTRIPNPVDLEVWRPGDRSAARAALGLPEEALVVGWHGRVAIDQKGLDVLAGAWRALAARVPGAHLLLIGGGRDEAELARLLDGLPRVTRVADHVHDPAALAARLAAADVYVLPSRHEGLPVALAEAMACGLPAVATRVGGVEQLLPPAAGDIVAPEDPAALADALEGLLADEVRRRAAGNAARAAAEAGFSLEAVGRALRAALGL
jgi:glycosyltransferase involved in cell wall biosynthesis